MIGEQSISEPRPLLCDEISHQVLFSLLRLIWKCILIQTTWPSLSAALWPDFWKQGTAGGLYRKASQAATVCRLLKGVSWHGGQEVYFVFLLITSPALTVMDCHSWVSTILSSLHLFALLLLCLHCLFQYPLLFFTPFYLTFGHSKQYKQYICNYLTYFYGQNERSWWDI